MNFNNFIFSTTGSIAEIDQNINALSGKKTINCIIGDETTPVNLEVPTGTTATIIEDINHGISSQVPSDDEITIPDDIETISIECYDTDNNLLAKYSCDEGFGVYLTDVSNNGNNGFMSAPAWSIKETITSWQPKIERAKQKLKIDLELVLKNTLKYRPYQDLEIVDAINNLDIFKEPSDYLTLKYIYQDLARGSENSVYYVKMIKAERIYNEMMDYRTKLIDLDINDDGETDIYNYDISKSLVQ